MMTVPTPSNLPDWQSILGAIPSTICALDGVEEAASTKENLQDNDSTAALAAVEVLARYRVAGPVDKWDSAGRNAVLQTMGSQIAGKRAIHMVVPAFPFKSPNMQDKVISKLPDLATELALSHLNGLAASVAERNRYGAVVIIVPDGIVYNDILGVADADVFRYAEEIQHTIRNLNLRHLYFLPLERVFAPTLSSPMTCEQYVAVVNDWRDTLFSQWLPDGYDVEAEIKSNPDALATYRGYCRFLSLDMASAIKHLSTNKRRAACSDAAKKMIMRGKCFSSLVATIPQHVRLSIHPSENTSKISVSLFPGRACQQRTVTPWHNAVIVDSKTGTYRVTSSGQAGKEYPVIVHKNSRPWYLCDDAPPLLSGGQACETELLYPHGVKLTANTDDGNPLDDLTPADYEILADLVNRYGMLVLAGFGHAFEEHVFHNTVQKQHDDGGDEIMSRRPSLAVEQLRDDDDTSAESSRANSLSNSIHGGSSSRSSSVTSTPSSTTATSGEQSPASEKEKLLNGLNNFSFDQATMTNAVSKLSLDGGASMRRASASSPFVVFFSDEKNNRRQPSIVSLRLAKEHDFDIDNHAIEPTAGLFQDRRHSYTPPSLNIISNEVDSLNVAEPALKVVIYDPKQCLVAS